MTYLDQRIPKRLTHKGRVYVATHLYGPGNLRQLSDRVAIHLEIDTELFWETDGPIIEEALAALVADGKLTLDGEVYKSDSGE